MWKGARGAFPLLHLGGEGQGEEVCTSSAALVQVRRVRGNPAADIPAAPTVGGLPRGPILGQLKVVHCDLIVRHMINRDSHLRVQRSISGDFRAEDIDRVILGLREMHRGRWQIKEIGDFLAHR